MTDRIYIRPIGLVPGPQSEHGNATRLAGGMVYASRFAVILRRDGQIVERWLAAPDTIAEVLGQLPDAVGGEAERCIPTAIFSSEHRRIQATCPCPRMSD